MSGVKIRRLTVAAAPGDTARAGALAAELARLLRQPVQPGGTVSAQRKISISVTPEAGAGADQIARQIAIELRRKLGQLD